MTHRHGFNDRSLHLYRSVSSGFLGRSIGKLTSHSIQNWTPIPQGSASDNPVIGYDQDFIPSALRFDKSVYRELASRYDICAATGEELEEIARVLYQHNEITLYDYTMLSFRTSSGSKSPLGFSGKTVIKRERRNWIRHFEERVLRSQGDSNMSAYLHEKHLLHVLKKLYRKD